MRPVERAVAQAARELATVSDTPRLDAEILMAHALGYERDGLLRWTLEHRDDFVPAKLIGGIVDPERRVSQRLRDMGPFREVFERRIALLRSDQIDRDLLEERARTLLGRVHPNDLVIITGPASK